MFKDVPVLIPEELKMYEVEASNTYDVSGCVIRFWKRLGPEEGPRILIKQIGPPDSQQILEQIEGNEWTRSIIYMKRLAKNFDEENNNGKTGNDTVL